MSYYLKLNLPQNPLRYDAATETKRIITGGYNLVRPHEVLSDEILNIFAQMGLKPSFVALFGRNDHDSSLDDRLIHTDLQLTRTGEWKKLLFGINWELEGSVNEFSWWDMSSIPEAWPNEELPEVSKYKILNGIHYGKRAQMGVPEGARQLDSTFIDGPTMVRTEIPHLTIYKSSTFDRLGISVRFDESQIPSWDHAVEKLRPFART